LDAGPKALIALALIADRWRGTPVRSTTSKGSSLPMANIRLREATKVHSNYALV
jgi:hypothetical protein